MAARNLYRLLVIYEETSINRRSYGIELDGQSIGEIGEEIILNHRMAPGWHILSIVGSWGSERTERFFVNDEQYITRAFIHLNGRNLPEVRIDSGTSAMVAMALHGPPEMQDNETRFVTETIAPPAPKRPRKIPTTVLWILGLVGAFVLGVFAAFLYYTLRGDSTLTAQPSPSPGASSSAAQDQRALSVPGATPADSRSAGTVGEFDVSIQSAVLTRNTDGDPALVITYSWVNNSGVTTSVLASVVEEAYQNDDALSMTTIGNREIYNPDEKYRDVRPGVALEIQSAFKLSDLQSPVSFRIADRLGYSEPITMNFFPAGAG